MDTCSDIEEGEISDGSDDVYKPLQRPENYSAAVKDHRFPVQVEPESDDDIESPSEPDSDSSGELNVSKRPKLKPKLKPKPTQQLNRKKYDIWSSRAQEDVLAETLVSCDVSNIDRSRTVETYDYPRRRNNYSPDEDEGYVPRTSSKRSNSDRSNRKLKPMQRTETDSGTKGSSRIILDLNVTAESTEEEIAKDIANKLCEEKEDLIYKIIVELGKEKSIQCFKETKRIEEDGGMLIMNQSRRRTPGGVFLFLVRYDNDLTLEQRNTIFGDERSKFRQEMKVKKKLRVKQWKDRMEASKKNLPELLTKAELCVQQLANGHDRTRRESKDSDVTNPPPSPVTDGHENSTDGMDNVNSVSSNILNVNEATGSTRDIDKYEEDFLDVGCGNDMDLF